eukprot:Gb_09104 [translate_table: standard]
MANFDVFINHRGVDVKDNLASHIYDLLQFYGVRAFLDREELRAGEEFSHAITEAIQSSSVHIAIFSPHYAKSHWCLRELALMVKTRNTIIPIFYNVKPEELRWANGAFAAANFDKHYQRYPQEVDEWRAALHKVSDIFGLSSDLKGGLAIKVVEEVLKNIKSEPLRGAKFPVGLEEPFERDSFIEDIKEQVEKWGLQEVLRKLLKNLLHQDYQVPDLSQSQGQQIIRNRLNNINNALIVLDNIENSDQLDDILPLEVLLPGSTLIVTSRDSTILKRCNEFLKYEMPELNPSQCKKLFCRHAFDSDVACAPFENLVDKFIDICDGVSLALEVCGGQFVLKSYDFCRSFLVKLTETNLTNNLVKLKRVLQESYAMLEEKQKQIFLDIAILFHGENKRTIERIWEEQSENAFLCDLETLEDKCMIKLYGNVVTMHEVFRDLGRTIVDEECRNDPGARSRLWRRNDVREVLKSGKVHF